GQRMTLASRCGVASDKKQTERYRTGDDYNKNPSAMTGLWHRRVVSRFRSLQSLGREVERPRDDKRNRKTDDNQQDDEPHTPIRDFEKGKNLGRDLNQQPTNNGVGDRYFINIAPLQFGEEIFRVQFACLRDDLYPKHL